MFGLFWHWVPFGVSTEYNYNYLLKNYLEVIVSFVYVFSCLKCASLVCCSFGYRHWTLGHWIFSTENSLTHTHIHIHIHTHTYKHTKHSSFYMTDALQMMTTIWLLANDIIRTMTFCIVTQPFVTLAKAKL